MQKPNKKLSAEQAAAVAQPLPATSNPSNTQAIVSVAGGGKTTTVAARINHLIEVEKIPASFIYAVTFTRAGGKALQEKIPHTLGHSGTLHSLAMNRTGFKPEQILTDEEGDALMADTLTELKLDRKLTKADARRALADPGPAIGDAGLFVSVFLRRLDERGKATHDTILRTYLRDLTKAPGSESLAVLVVDEAQDTAAIDAAIYTALAPTILTIAVGDPRQAIYQFRGASAQWLRRCIRRARRTNTFNHLTCTFRCSRRVTARAAVFEPDIRNHPDNAGGSDTERTFDNQRQEEDWIILTAKARLHGESIAILCRYNIDVDRIRSAFETSGLELAPRVSARHAADTETTDSLIAIARAIASGSRHHDMDEILRECRENLEPAQAGRITRRWSQPSHIHDALRTMVDPSLQKQVALFCPTHDQAHHPALQACEDARSLLTYLTGEGAPAIDDTTGIHVDTVHASKGREWDHVIVAGCDNRMDTQTEEGDNLLYTAITRAKETISFTRAAMIVDPWSGGSKTYTTECESIRLDPEPETALDDDEL